MIGLITKDVERSVAPEFFELFKTSWEPYVSGRTYGCVITTTGCIPEDPAVELVVVYDSRELPRDRKLGMVTWVQEPGAWVERDESEFPIYGRSIAFQGTEQCSLGLKNAKKVLGYESYRDSRRIVRVGYDLFHEVAFLLSQGQPPENAAIPTLELHISVLRDILVRNGVPFVEVLGTPAGYDFMACLTHDVDFTGIREHKFDSTMFGFLYRATIASLKDALKGKTSWSKCWTNWRAALSLPLVHLGLKEDFWLEFDRFIELEKGLGSTFFFIPFRKYAGTLRDRPAPAIRAAKYDFLEIREQVRDLANRDCEIGLHGIDAWQNSELAARERERVCEVTGQSEVGVRMHWLYFDQDSPKALEGAGLGYDSTFGYNEAVGFRAGTAQAFHIFPSNHLMELPLSIQDTALFYPGRMGLTEASAMDRCRHIFRQAATFGGAVVVNWHTRSLSPERLWGDFYRRFLQEIQQFRVWFGTAQAAVNWFRARRDIRIEEVLPSGVRLRMSARPAEHKSLFVVRVYSPLENFPQHANRDCSTSAFRDIPWDGEDELLTLHEEHSQV